jgi:hypothetical protein
MTLEERLRMLLDTYGSYTTGTDKRTNHDAKLFVLGQMNEILGQLILETKKESI